MGIRRVELTTGILLTDCVIFYVVNHSLTLRR